MQTKDIRGWVMFNLSLVLNSDIMPEVTGAWVSFFSGIAHFFVWLASVVIKGLASLAFLICKLVMGLIDFMQFLVQKLAGIEVYMNMEKFDVDSLKQSDIVFRFLLSDTVAEVLRSVFVVFIVLLIVFTIFAIIKNEYSAASSGSGDNLDHRKSWYAAAKAVLTVILVPVLLIMGIMGSNAILASIARAYNVSGTLSLGGQVFVASSYDASLYRNYANNGVRKYTSNKVSFEYEGTTYTVNSAMEVITPNSYSNSKPFTGYMFTYDGKTYYLCKCDATDTEMSGTSTIYYNRAYYYYIKYVLGAYIVESNPAHDSEIQDDFREKGYNTTNIPSDDESIISNVKEVYNDFIGKWVWTKALSIVNNVLTFGLLQEDQAYLSENGFMIHKLRDENGGSLLIDAAYNTWSYNSIVATDLSDWGSQNVSLETNTDTFTTLGGRQRVATVVKNSSAWGKLHDGGVDGFHPLSVEYLAMADVMDFVLENGVTLYYVNANNSNISYESGKVGLEYRYRSTGDGGLQSAGFDGFLVDYKNVGRVAYKVDNDAVSELDGAVYVVCYFDSTLNKYIPVVNGEKIYDSKGNSYLFSSSQYSRDYKGVVIARGMFKDSSQARATEPTYLTSSMVVGNKKTDFDSKKATALKLDLLSSSIGYNYLQQLTTATTEDVNYYNTLTPNVCDKDEAGWNFGDDNYYWNGTNLIYCVNKSFSGTDLNALYSHMADILVNKICISDGGVGVKSFEMVNDSMTSEIGKCTFKIKRIGAGDSEQTYTVTMKIDVAVINTKNGQAYRYIVTPTIETITIPTSKKIKGNPSYLIEFDNDGKTYIYSNSSTFKHIYTSGIGLDKDQAVVAINKIVEAFDVPSNYKLQFKLASGSLVDTLTKDDLSDITGGKFSLKIAFVDKQSYNAERYYQLSFDFEKWSDTSYWTSENKKEDMTCRVILDTVLVAEGDLSNKIVWENKKIDDNTRVVYNVLGETLVNTNGDGSYGDIAYIYSKDNAKIYDNDNSNSFNQFNKEQTAKVLSNMINSFISESGYKYQFLILSVDDQGSFKIELKDKLAGSDLSDLENGQLKSIYLALVKTSDSEGGSGTSEIRRIYSLTFDFSAGADSKYQDIINNSTNENHYWKENGVNTEFECRDVFIFLVSPVSDDPKFSMIHKAPEFEEDHFYNQINYKTLKDEFFYYDNADGMKDANLSATVDTLAKSFVENILNIENCKYVENSTTYSGNVEFAHDSTGSLVVNFSVIVGDESKYYYVDFSLSMSSYECINPLETQKRYLYKFDVNYNVYNTYNLYVGGKVGQVLNEEGNLVNLVITTKDLSYNGTDEYTILEYADSSKNTTTTVYQYIYKEYTKTGTYFHTFNAVAGKSNVDDGKRFITGSIDEGTFNPSFGITSSGEIKETASASLQEIDNVRKLVFSTAKMRIIYMPDFSAIFDPSKYKNDGTQGNTTAQVSAEDNILNQNEDFYTFLIVDTQNPIQDQAHYYTMEFNKNAESIDWENVEIKAYTYSMGGETELGDGKNTAKEYIQSHFRMEIVDIDLHNYQDISTKAIDEVNYYKTTIVTNNGRVINYSSRNALDNLTGDNSSSVFSASVMEQRLIDKANNFNNNANVINIDYIDYHKAHDLDEIVTGIQKMISNPIAVLCCRDDVTTAQIVADFHINLLSDTLGFKFTFRMPRFAFATVQKNTTDYSVLTLAKGQFSMDYNFEGYIALGNIYSVVDINYLILLLAIIIIFGILGKAVWGLIGRIYQITLLYLMMPLVASTLPIDEKGTRFESWKKQMIDEVLSTYGVTIGLNFFFIILPVIRESTEIFTDADFVNMSSTMKFFAGSPERLNYICYILFMLVAFTLLNTVPKMVQEFTGHSKDVISSGADLKAQTVKTVTEAGKKASDFITGKTLVDGAVGTYKKAKGMAMGLIPGKAIYDEVQAKRKKNEEKKKAEEENRQKENQKMAVDHARERADQEKVKFEEAKAKRAAATAGAQQPPVSAGVGTSQGATPSAQNATRADVAGDLDETAKQAIVNEAVSQSGEYTEVAMGMAEAAMEAADAQFGRTHDYVADREKEEAELKAAEKAQRDYEKSRIGKAEADLENAMEGNKTKRLNAKDIEEWNKTHGADDQISTKKITRDQFADEDKFREARRKDRANREKARRQKAIIEAENRFRDEKEGIKHGIGYSAMRTFIGGRKTWNQRMKDAEKLQKEQEKHQQELTRLNQEQANKLKALDDEKKQIENDRVKDSVASLTEYQIGTFTETQVRRALDNASYATYQQKFNDMKNDPNNKFKDDQEIRKEVLTSMNEEANAMYDKQIADLKLDKRRKKINDSYKKKTENANKKLENAEDRLTKDRKGWVYTLGSVINTKVKPGLSKAKVPARWLADKGHTFIAGHTEQDKETARDLLRKQREYRLNLEKANAELKNAEKAEFANFVEDYKQIKNKNTENAKDMFDHLQKNRDLLTVMGFMNQKGLSKDFVNNEQKKNGWPEDEKQKVVKIFDGFIKNSPRITNPGSQSELKQAQMARNTAQQDLDLFNAKNKNSLKKAEQMLNDKHIRSIGVVGEIKRAKNAIGNSVVSQKVKDVGQKVKDFGQAAKSWAKNKYNEKRIVAWHHDRAAAKADAVAYTKQNANAVLEEKRKKDKSVEDLIDKTLSSTRQRQQREIEENLQKRIDRLRAKDKSKPFKAANALKVTEMERLLKGFKAGTLTDAEKKQIDKYLNFSAAKANAQYERTQRRLSRYQATTSSRQRQSEKIEDLNKNTIRAYEDMLRKGLAGIGMSQAEIDARINKYAKSNANEFYKQMKQEINSITATKQQAMQKALANGKSNLKLLTEIRQLNSLVGSMRTTDARYRKDIVQLKESNRKLGKQLRSKKSADALSSSIKLQVDNPYNNGGNNGNNGGNP